MNRIHIERLQNGQPTEFRGKGNSMTPIIRSGQKVRVVPADAVEVGEVVLATVNGNLYLHKVGAKSIDGNKTRYRIENNHGHVNGWTSAEKVYGKLDVVLD